MLRTSFNNLMYVHNNKNQKQNGGGEQLSIDMFLSNEQRLFQDIVRQFAKNELAHDAVQRANNDHIDETTMNKIVDMGLMGIMIPESDGGQGGTLVDAILAIMAVALSCPRSADFVQAGNFGAIRTFAAFASQTQKERWLHGLLKGRLLMSVGMSEPEAGSAVTDLQTSLTPDGEGFRLNGTKVFGTHSATADIILAYARFGPGVHGIGSVIVEKNMDGFSTGQSVRYMNGEKWAQLYFDNVYIPKENILLGPGGFKKQISGFNVERLGNAARAVAVGRHAFNVARTHAKMRHQFGRPLCEFQGIQWKFADMSVKLDAAELMLINAAISAGSDLPGAYDTAATKLLCNEAGYFAANEALQVMGALGFGEDNIVQYCMRRTRGWMIAGGTLEILRNRIAEHVFDQRFSQRP